MLISIDHGNKQVKTIHHAPFTSGLVCSEVRPFGGETLTYQGRYYTLTDQRIPYRRDKTEDERFFVLTLFAIAYELEAVSFYGAGAVRVQLAVGLPPAHYGAQQKRFAEYFLNRGTVSFTLHDRQYEVLIDEVSCSTRSPMPQPLRYSRRCKAAPGRLSLTSAALRQIICCFGTARAT